MERVLALQNHRSNNTILPPPAYPVLPSPDACPAAGQARLHMPTWLRSLADDWKSNYELDRVLLPVAAAVQATHTAALWRHGSLTLLENLQNLLFLVPLCAAAALCRAAPAWYRPRAAPLRCVLLLLGHCRPVFSSLGAMDPPVTGPSQVPVVGPLLDAFFLWMATKHCFLLFAAGTLRPPLYVAVLLQASGVWRANRAGFCTSAVLRHPVMQRRAALVHSAFGLAYQAVLGQPLGFVSGHDDPEHRCRSLYLFCSLVLSFLLPLLLLIAMHKPSPGAGGSSVGAAAPGMRSTRPSRTARLERWLQAQLGMLLWQPDSSPHRAGQQPRRQERQGQWAGVPRGLLLVALRWLSLALALWAASCLVVGGF